MSLLKRSAWTLAAAGAVIAGSPAFAAATYSSNANAASVRIGTVNVVSPDAVAGSGTGSYSQAGTLASFGQSANVGAAGVATISERVGGGIASERASGTGTSATGTISLTTPVIAFDSSATLPFVGTIVTNLFGITADAISSTSTVTNMNGTLTATGLSSIANLRFTGAAAALSTIVGTLAVNPAANTVFALGNALTLTLNEQILTPGTGALALQTNALHLVLNGFDVGGAALSGDFVLGHSAASVTGATPTATAAVPEPASWAMMIAGFGLMGAMLRASRRAPRVTVA